MIELYTAATPNGHKASVTLEELALPYRVHAINLGAGEPTTPAFPQSSTPTTAASPCSSPARS